MRKWNIYCQCIKGFEGLVIFLQTPILIAQQHLGFDVQPLILPNRYLFRRTTKDAKIVVRLALHLIQIDVDYKHDIVLGSWAYFTYIITLLSRLTIYYLASKSQQISQFSITIFKAQTGKLLSKTFINQTDIVVLSGPMLIIFSFETYFGTCSWSQSQTQVGNHNPNISLMNDIFCDLYATRNRTMQPNSHPFEQAAKSSWVTNSMKTKTCGKCGVSSVFWLSENSQAPRPFLKLKNNFLE